MNHPKILIMINDFHVGGAQRLITQQIPRFIRRGFSVAVVTLMNDSKKENFYQDIPSEVAIYKIGMKTAYDIPGIWQLFTVIKKVNPDVIFSHLFLANAFSRILKILFSFNVISIEHNTYIYKKNKELWIDRLLAPLSKKIVAVSDDVKALTVKQQWIRSEKCIVIPNSVDIQKIDEYRKTANRSKLRKQFGFVDDEKIFIMVGRLSTQKNQALAIDAFISFAKRHRARLIIAGEGVLMEDLQRQIEKLDAGQHIVLLGNKENIFDYYQATDFFLSTSHIEGLSLAFLEALAFGVPLVVTKTGGTKDLVVDGENGIIIESSTKDAVERALIRALSLPKDAGILARNTAEKFSIENNVDAYVGLI